MNSRQKPPQRLEKKLARVAREQGIDQERLRHWVSFLALCGVLERACHENILGVYYLKGGVAMELRFAQRARATKDLDLEMEGTRAGRLQVLSEALRLGFDQFSFRLKAQVRDMEQADTVRVQVSIQYRTRSWQTIEVDLQRLPPAALEVEALLVHFAREDSGWGHAMPICHACSIPSGPTGNHRSRRSGPGRVLQRGARSLPQRLLLTRNGVN
jgi:hypothetical protein